MILDSKDILRLIRGYKNPYPKDIFTWNGKEKINITKGRFNEWIHTVVENTKQDIIKIIQEDETEIIKKPIKICPNCNPARQLTESGYCRDCGKHYDHKGDEQL